MAVVKKRSTSQQAALERAEVAGLVSTAVSSRVVAAVFGEASQAEADELIGLALASQ